MLQFPIKIYPFEIFTRASPGSSLVTRYLRTSSKSTSRHRDSKCVVQEEEDIFQRSFSRGSYALEKYLGSWEKTKAFLQKSSSFLTQPSGGDPLPWRRWKKDPCRKVWFMACISCSLTLEICRKNVPCHCLECLQWPVWAPEHPVEDGGHLHGELSPDPQGGDRGPVEGHPDRAHSLQL